MRESGIGRHLSRQNMADHAGERVGDLDLDRTHELTGAGGADKSHGTAGEVVRDALVGDAHRELAVSTLASAKRVDSLLPKGILGLFCIER